MNKPNEEVNLKDAADNVVLLEEAVFERIVDVFCEVMANPEYKRERDRILTAIKIGEDRHHRDLEFQYQKQMATMQQNTSQWTATQWDAAAQYNAAMQQKIQQSLQNSYPQCLPTPPQSVPEPAPTKKSFFDKFKLDFFF